MYDCQPGGKDHFEAGRQAISAPLRRRAAACLSPGIREFDPCAGRTSVVLTNRQVLVEATNVRLIRLSG
jgi:hypothetical protein